MPHARYVSSMIRPNTITLFYCIFFLSGCGLSIFKHNSQDEKRLRDNVHYAATLFQQEAPESLPTPLDYGFLRPYSLAAIDSLYVEQIKPPQNMAAESSAFKKEAEKYIGEIDTLSFPCILHKGNKTLSIETLSPIVGEVCQRAFIHEYLESTNISKMLFPKLKGIEAIRQPSPVLALLSTFESGPTYASLLEQFTAHSQPEIEKAFSLLGEALAEVHSTCTPEKQPLSHQWVDSIHRLLDSFSHRYQGAPGRVAEAAQYISDCAYHILFAYEKRKKTFHVGLALGNTDLDAFMMPDSTHALYLTPVAIGSALQPSSPIRATGLISYDYCRQWHHITLLAARHIQEKARAAIIKAWENGYKRSNEKPSKDEMLFFSLIDLMHRIEREYTTIYPNKLKNWNLARSTLEILDHRNSLGCPQSDGDGLVAKDVGEDKTNSSTCLGISSISLSLLEEELVQWSESIKHMRTKK